MWMQAPLPCDVALTASSDNAAVKGLKGVNKHNLGVYTHLKGC